MGSSYNYSCQTVRISAAVNDTYCTMVDSIGGTAQDLSIHSPNYLSSMASRAMVDSRISRLLSQGVFMRVLATKSCVHDSVRHFGVCVGLMSFVSGNTCSATSVIKHDIQQRALNHQLFLGRTLIAVTGQKLGCVWQGTMDKVVSSGCVRGLFLQYNNYARKQICRFQLRWWLDAGFLWEYSLIRAHQIDP